MIEYCGPYSIQTTNAVISEQIVDSKVVVVERNQLKDYENPVLQYIE